jgi:hypothetical protein
MIILVRWMHVGCWYQSKKDNDHLEDLEVGGRIMYKLIREEWTRVVQTGLICLRIRTSGGLL